MHKHLETVFGHLNTARIGPYILKRKARVAHFGVQVFFGLGAPSIWSCAPKILAVRLKIYTWSHKCSQSKK